MRKSFTILATTSAFALLSACGGGGGGGSSSSGGATPPNVSNPTPTTPSYETLSSTAAKTSALGGVALRSNNTSGALEVVTTSGTTTHNTGRTTITDGTYSLTDPDGFDNNGRLTDGTSTIVTPAFVTNGTYEYVTTYAQSYTAEGTSYDSLGVGGVITSEADVPTSGSATYTGEATAQIVTATQGTDLTFGTSTVAANFGAGTVDVTMTDFTATDQATGNATTAPIDTISATGMNISGNRFSGGTVTTSNGGANVALTGANTSTAAAGAFFGYDDGAAAPDEVGGAILIQGDDGIVTGGFIAD